MSPLPVPSSCCRSPRSTTTGCRCRTISRMSVTRTSSRSRGATDPSAHPVCSWHWRQLASTRSADGPHLSATPGPSTHSPTAAYPLAAIPASGTTTVVAVAPPESATRSSTTLRSTSTTGAPRARRRSPAASPTPWSNDPSTTTQGRDGGSSNIATHRQYCPPAPAGCKEPPASRHSCCVPHESRARTRRANISTPLGLPLERVRGGSTSRSGPWTWPSTVG